MNKIKLDNKEWYVIKSSEEFGDALQDSIFEWNRKSSYIRSNDKKYILLYFDTTSVIYKGQGLYNINIDPIWLGEEYKYNIKIDYKNIQKVISNLLNDVYINLDIIKKLNGEA